MVSGEWFFQYTTLYNSTYTTYNTTYFIIKKMKFDSRPKIMEAIFMYKVHRVRPFYQYET